MQGRLHGLRSATPPALNEPDHRRQDQAAWEQHQHREPELRGRAHTTRHVQKACHRKDERFRAIARHPSGVVVAAYLALRRPPQAVGDDADQGAWMATKSVSPSPVT